MFKANLCRSATGAKLQLTVNAVDNTVSIIPIGPMATTDNLPNHDGVEFAEQTPAFTNEDIGTPSNVDSPKQSSSKDKVPRPPNAFIIYRREWHPKVVAEHVSSLLSHFPTIVFSSDFYTAIAAQ